MNEHEVDRGESFTGEKTRTQTLKHAQTSQIKYDLIGKVAEGTVLTRKTVAAILKGLRVDKLYMFKNNPEEFISKVIKLIREQKATMIVEHISYNQLEGGYDSTIFTAEKSAQTFDKAFRANKAIQDYVFTDGSAEKSIERRFVEDLDAAQEVCVYAKLPKGFHIPTPVGNYSPDWAIAFYERTAVSYTHLKEYRSIMGKADFSNPKSVTLLTDLVVYATRADENAIILDCFSGSSTTAHAVMKANILESLGNRKFIMVQLPEAIDETSDAYKMGYNNICEIGKERIRRAGAKIKEENPLGTQQLDVG